jgi:RNAse (barnase) inhibitor barstar
MASTLKWSPLFKEVSPWAHIAVSDESGIDDFVRTTGDERGTVIRVLRGRRCTDKPRLFQEWAAALQFPSYFGENWDAFEDCLLDLEWLPATGYVFIITNSDLVLRDAPADFQTFFDILRNAATTWMRTPEKPEASARVPATFHVVFHCLPGAESGTRSRLQKAGIKIS